MAYDVSGLPTEYFNPGELDVEVSQTLAELKAFLRVTHDEDDALLTALGDAAGDELARYLEVSELPTVASVTVAVMMLVRSNYDAETPDDSARWRDVARTMAHSYRTGMGA